MVPPLSVVEAFDVAEDRRARFGASLDIAVANQLLLERGEETLHHGVVAWAIVTRRRLLRRASIPALRPSQPTRKESPGHLRLDI